MAQSNIDIIIKAVDKSGNTLKTTKKNLDGIGDASKTSKGKLDSMKVGLAQVAIVAGVVTAALVIAKKAFDFAKEGAGILRLEEAGTHLAVSMGGDFQEIQDALQEASLGMVSDLDIMAGASRAMALRLGADSEKLAQLMQVAAFRARQFGLSTSQAFNDIVTGIGRMSPLILDNLGIVIDARVKYAAYAESIGTTAAALTSAEKRQALLNAVLEEGNKQIAEAGGLALDAAGKFERLEATIKNLADEGKTKLVPFFSRAAEALTDILTYTDKMNAAFEEHSKNVLITSDSYKEYTDEILRSAVVASQLSQAQADFIRTNIEQENSVMSLTSSFEEETKAIGLLTEAEFEAARRLGQLNEITNEYKGDLEDQTSAVLDNVDALKEAHFAQIVLRANIKNTALATLEMKNDTDLLKFALEAGMITQEEYTVRLALMKEGFEQLTPAERAEIEAQIALQEQTERTKDELAEMNAVQEEARRVAQAVKDALVNQTLAYFDLVEQLSAAKTKSDFTQIAMDLLIKALRDGKIEPEEFATAMFELGGDIGTLTEHGVAAEEAFGEFLAIIADPASPTNAVRLLEILRKEVEDDTFAFGDLEDGAVDAGLEIETQAEKMDTALFELRIEPLQNMNKELLGIFQQSPTAASNFKGATEGMTESNDALEIGNVEAAANALVAINAIPRNMTFDISFNIGDIPEIPGGGGGGGNGNGGDDPGPEFEGASGGDFIVPPGFNNDSFRMNVESGEHVTVTPAGQTRSSSVNHITLNAYGINDPDKFMRIMKRKLTRQGVQI